MKDGSMTPPDRLRALLAKPDFVVMPAVWDGLSAKLAAGAGFETAFLSGSCVAASRLGGPDLDLISFAEMFDSFNMVRGAAAQTLVLADGDHGYGNAMNVQRTVRAYGRAGAAAILIEDKITPRALTAAGKPCLPRDEARMKIRAAVEAAKESGILVMARTDCRPTQGIDEAVARIEMYVKEGADIVFLDSPADEDEVGRAVAAAAGRPSFAVLSPGAPRATPSRLRAAELGFKIGTYPTGMLSPAMAGMKAGLAALIAGEAEAPSALPPAELRATLGYPDYDAQAKVFIVSKFRGKLGVEAMLTIDSQVHTYERNHPGRPWIGVLHGPPEVTGDHMVAAMDAVAVDGALLVSPFAMYRFDASYALEVHGKHPGRFGLIKPVDTTNPAVAEAIADWAATKGTVGVRIMMNSELSTDPADPGINRVLAAAAQHALPVNILCWGRLEQAGQLAARNPDTSIVVDHLGLQQPFEPPPPAEPFADLPKVLALAVHKNVAIKISGACTLSHEPFPYRDIWDPVCRIIDAFGLDRCMWGTDWTRATALLTYKQGVEAFRASKDLSDSDRAALMGGTLQRIYDWSPSRD